MQSINPLDVLRYVWINWIVWVDINVTTILRLDNISTWFSQEILSHTEDALDETLNHFYLVSAHIIEPSPQGKHKVSVNQFETWNTISKIWNFNLYRLQKKDSLPFAMRDICLAIPWATIIMGSSIQLTHWAQPLCTVGRHVNISILYSILAFRLDTVKGSRDFAMISPIPAMKRKRNRELFFSIRKFRIITKI